MPFKKIFKAAKKIVKTVVKIITKPLSWLMPDIDIPDFGTTDFDDFEKRSGRKTNNTSQQRFFSTDVGMDFSSQTVLDIKWGRP